MSRTHQEEKIIPALGYDALTPFYDLGVRLTVRETAFKSRLVTQSNIKPGQRVLDVGCGTGTLAIMLKKANPEAFIYGLDGDSKILHIAKKKAVKAGIDIRFDEGMSFNLPYEDSFLTLSSQASSFIT